MNSTRRYFRVFGCALFALTSWQAAPAATFNWDPDTTASNNVYNTQAGLGGTGNWSSGNNWWNRLTNTNEPWSNGPGDIAQFGGLASGTVTVSGIVTVGRLIFTTNNYTISAGGGSNILVLENGFGTPTVIEALANATIGSGGITGVDGLLKMGGGTLTVQGNNTGFAGPITLNAGTLTSSGSSNALSSDNITINFGTLRLINNGTAANMVTAIAYNNTVIAQGTGTLNVDRVSGTNTNNTISISNLIVGNSTLTLTNGNGYGLQVTGSTTLNGALSTLNTAMNPVGPGSANPTAGMVALSGAVTGASGVLNKIGAGTIVLQAANDYAGGTNILAGTVLLNTSTATLGSGSTIVNPGATLAITDGSQVALTGSQKLALTSSGSSLSALRFDADFNHTANGSSLSSALVSPYGAAVQINTGFANYNASGVPGAAATFTNNIDLGLIGSTAAGNGPVYLGASTTSSVSGQIKAAADNVLPLGGGGTLNLTAANQLSALNDASTTLVVGSPISNVQTVTNGTGIVAIQNSNA
ncbi:MAG: hypothetical protein JWO89_1241, partial [Verrucomicrobiaceae bacterium]|nr:hypothetical protein [Verrucomicrobiaceae bacterium]